MDVERDSPGPTLAFVLTRSPSGASESEPAVTVKIITTSDVSPATGVVTRLLSDTAAGPVRDQRLSVFAGLLPERGDQRLDTFPPARQTASSPSAVHAGHELSVAARTGGLRARVLRHVLQRDLAPVSPKAKRRAHVFIYNLTLGLRKVVVVCGRRSSAAAHFCE